MDKQQQKTLTFFGYSVEEIPGKTVPRMTYYNKDGRPLENLPADPYHMERYLKRGFTLKPPEKVEVTPTEVERTPVHRKTKKGGN